MGGGRSQGYTDSNDLSPEEIHELKKPARITEEGVTFLSEEYRAAGYRLVPMYDLLPDDFNPSREEQHTMMLVEYRNKPDEVHETDLVNVRHGPDGAAEDVDELFPYAESDNRLGSQRSDLDRLSTWLAGEEQPQSTVVLHGTIPAADLPSHGDISADATTPLDEYIPETFGVPADSVTDEIEHRAEQYLDAEVYSEEAYKEAVEDAVKRDISKVDRELLR